jgi:hypothetical protein
MVLRLSVVVTAPKHLLDDGIVSRHLSLKNKSQKNGSSHPTCHMFLPLGARCREKKHQPPESKRATPNQEEKKKRKKTTGPPGSSKSQSL